MRIPLPNFFPANKPAYVQKLEDDVVRLQRVLNTTPPAQKQLLSDTRASLADVEYRLKVHRENVSNSPEVLGKRKQDELAAARAELDRLSKASTDKALLSAARAKILDLESWVKDFASSNSSAARK